MTAPSDRGRRRMVNLQTAVVLLVTAGIVWLGLTRIDLSETVAAFAVVRVGLSLPGRAHRCRDAIFAVRWRPVAPDQPQPPDAIRLLISDDFAI
jgi:hypothetical protein